MSGQLVDFFSSLLLKSKQVWLIKIWIYNFLDTEELTYKLPMV